MFLTLSAFLVILMFSVVPIVQTSARADRRQGVRCPGVDRTSNSSYVSNVSNGPTISDRPNDSSVSYIGKLAQRPVRLCFISKSSDSGMVSNSSNVSNGGSESSRQSIVRSTDGGGSNQLFLTFLSFLT